MVLLACSSDVDEFADSNAFAALVGEASGHDPTEFFDSWLHGAELSELPTTD